MQQRVTESLPRASRALAAVRREPRGQAGSNECKDIEARARDLELTRRASRGDVSAQRALVHRLVRRIRQVARLMLGNVAEVDDVAQHALCEVLRSTRTFDANGSLEEWGDQIAVGVALCVSRRIRAEREIHVGLSEGIQDGSSSPQARVLAAAELNHALAGLKWSRQQALILKCALGYTVEEIAEIAGVPTGTVKDRLVAARRELRRIARREEVLECARPWNGRADDIRSDPHFTPNGVA